jgi:hypothetical protein
MISSLTLAEASPRFDTHFLLPRHIEDPYAPRLLDLTVSCRIRKPRKLPRQLY